MDTFGSFTDQSQEGFRQHAKQSNQRLFANAGLRLSDHAETRLYVTAVQTDSELPGSLTQAQPRANPRLANAGNVALEPGSRRPTPAARRLAGPGLGVRPLRRYSHPIS